MITARGGPGGRRLLRGAARWSAVLLLPVEALLVLAAGLPVGTAAIAAVVVETLLLGVVAADVVLIRRATARSRAQGNDANTVLADALGAVLPGPLARVLGYELGLARALWRWMRRRPDVPAGGVALPYQAAMTPVLWAVLGLSFVEVPLTALLVPWRSARLVLLVLSGYGVLWLLGFIAALTTRPHVVTDDLLVIRFGHFVERAVPLALVSSVRPERHSGHRRVLQVDGGVLAMAAGDCTTVAVRLRSPWTATGRRGAAPQAVTEIRFHADDAPAAIRAVQAAAGIAD